MTDKQIIILKPEEDLNEKIIKEKGNTKCIFYADDICRNGDKTRDCINCARVEYHSLYSLNWDNQERLQRIINQKEQECEELKEYEKSLLNVIDDLQKTKNEWQEKYNDLGQDFDQLKRQHESDKGLITSTGKMNYQLLQEYDKMKQTLAEIKEIAENAYCLTNYTNKDMAQFAKQILQKISECEVKDDNK